MGSEVIIVPILFGVIFGIVYLFISSRHKERIALIDKGVDASIFYGDTRKNAWGWRLIVLNLALLLMGIGIGVFIAGILENHFGVESSVAYPGTIFTLAGAGLFLSFKMSKTVE